MAAMFAGASRALLASVVFAFETTRQPLGLLPLLGGCSGGLPRLGRADEAHHHDREASPVAARVVPAEYAADLLAQWRAGEFSSRPVVTLGAAETVGEALRRLANVVHQGFPVIDGKRVVGVVMRRALVAASPGRRVAELIERPPVTVHASDTLRHAADVMAHTGVGRLPVLSDGPSPALVGMLTRSDLVGAHRPRLRAERVAARALARG